jgi:ankyrin repeat protein
MLKTTKNRLNKATCIQLATAGGHKEAVKLLLDAGSNPLEENQDGMTPLHLGKKNINEKIVIIG